MTTPGPSSRVQLPAAGGGFFEVDISRAPDAIRDLELARDELDSIRRQAGSLAQVERTARDAVSEDAARMLEQAATGPAGVLQALEAGQNEIQSLIDSLREAFDAYRRGDGDAAASYRSTS